MKTYKISLFLLILFSMLCNVEAREKFWKSNQTWGYITTIDLSKTLLTKTSSYDMLSSDSFIIADGSSSAIDIKVPNPALVNGSEYVIKAVNVDNIVRLMPFGSEKFDGADYIQFAIKNTSVTIISNGIGWLIK